jgi:hypothetical protein
MDKERKREFVMRAVIGDVEAGDMIWRCSRVSTSRRQSVVGKMNIGRLFRESNAKSLVVALSTKM